MQVGIFGRILGPTGECAHWPLATTKSKISSSRIVASNICTCATGLTIPDAQWLCVRVCVHLGHRNLCPPRTQDTGLCSLPCPWTELRNAQQQIVWKGTKPALHILHTMHLNWYSNSSSMEGIEWDRSAAFKSKTGQWQPQHNNGERCPAGEMEVKRRGSPSFWHNITFINIPFWNVLKRPSSSEVHYQVLEMLMNRFGLWLCRDNSFRDACVKSSLVSSVTLLAL